MRRVLPFVLVAVVCAVLVACQPGAAGLSAQDKAAIRQVVDEGTKIATAQNADYAAYVKLYYAEDATVLASNMPPVQGRAAIQAMLSSFPPMTEFKVDLVDIDGRGDLAYVRGNYSMTVKPAGAPAVTDKGKYVEVWKKGADGTWKVSYDSWNSDLPVPGLVIPTGAVAADASPEIKKLADVVGRWQMDGTFQPDPKVPAGPVAITMTCDWFTGGRQVFCLMSGTLAGAPYEEIYPYSYDSKAKAYAFFSTVSDGTSGVGKLAIEPGTWIHTSDAQVEGKPAKVRFTLANMSPAGGAWKHEVSVAGGPWAVMGEGKYTRAQ